MQNTPFSFRKLEHFLGRGTAHCPDPSPSGRGDTPSHIHPDDPRAFDAQPLPPLQNPRHATAPSVTIGRIYE